MNQTVAIYKHNGLKVMLVTIDHDLSEILEAFENVLKGAGFSFKGTLDFVEDAV